jgi:hypothetical protein
MNILVDTSITTENCEEKGFSYGLTMLHLSDLLRFEQCFLLGCVIGDHMQEADERELILFYPSKLSGRKIGEVLPITTINKRDALSNGYIFLKSLPSNLPFYDLFEQNEGVWEEGILFSKDGEKIEVYKKFKK